MYYLMVSGQNMVNPEPIIIQGQLTDCPEKLLFIQFEDLNEQSVLDTIHLDKDGNIYLKSFKITKPQRTSIWNNRIQINRLFVAPGYNLRITGNGKDFQSLMKTKKISGIGSECNQHTFLLDSLFFEDTSKYYKMKESDLLVYSKKYKQLQDSIADLVFHKKPVQDKYFSFFDKMVRLDSKFFELYMLVTHANDNNFNAENSIALVRNNFDTSVINNLFREEYLISTNYKNLMSSEYLNYLIKIDNQLDSNLSRQKGNRLEKINKLYTGRLKEFVMYKYMFNSIVISKSFSKLNDLKKQFEPYNAAFTNLSFKKSIDTKMVEKETELLKTQIGQPAPPFALENNQGQVYRLEDFKGKVVYIDLWASWCGPCRRETPSFKILYNKYKNDNRVTFISIAVHDGVEQWEKAIKEDNPLWLQLIDKEGIVETSYVANAIPQFILVDKMGKIVNFDAPRPSSGLQIETLINQEIGK